MQQRYTILLPSVIGKRSHTSARSISKQQMKRSIVLSQFSYRNGNVTNAMFIFRQQLEKLENSWET